MGGNGLKEWNGMRGGGRRSRESFKTGDARAKVFNKVFTDLSAFRFGGFGGNEGNGGGAASGGGRRVTGSGRKGGKSGRGKEGRKDVVPVMKSGGKRRIL